MASNDPGAEFWELVAPHTGKVSRFEYTARGFTSSVTMTVECEAGPLFLKGLRLPSRDVVCFDRESRINPHVLAVSPRLRWVARTDEWYVLGFELVAGPVADFGPLSHDVPAVLDTVNELASLKLPGVAETWAEWRWNRFTDRPELFAGDDLLHTDINPDNIIMREGRAWLVDWAYPTRGAGFIDPACLVIQLIASGRTAEVAEQCVGGCQAWNLADPAALDEFSRASVRLHEEAVERGPEDWKVAMLRAAEAWARLRYARSG